MRRRSCSAVNRRPSAATAGWWPSTSCVNGAGSRLSTSDPAGGMKIVVTHLTRMREGRICVAGLTNAGEHIRPRPWEAELDRSHLLTRGGIFDIGAVVDLGTVENIGLPPEVEDRGFSLGSAIYERHLNADVYWK